MLLMYCFLLVPMGIPYALIGVSLCKSPPPDESHWFLSGITFVNLVCSANLGVYPLMLFLAVASEWLSPGAKREMGHVFAATFAFSLTLITISINLLGWLSARTARVEQRARKPDAGSVAVAAVAYIFYWLYAASVVGDYLGG